ncbi:DUF2177 family protein [Devosia rhodophyticola]|uniref:DUF2177 family protein n=1 Tax=Devosia rhodophyticola TaxID=3026423 RepID=A0ABY7YUR0_9HYPH|nr:DUF2177 family protein [Devosia rhodophyticola]WDR05093.1 DUF2177 family protein [Devosia rhodophyticola]
MSKFLILYAACTVVFFALDFVWLTTIAKSTYQREIGSILLPNPNLAVAAGFYLLYLVGVVVLVAAPAEGDVLKALLTGALLGFVAYGTYDLTNLSTLKGFTPTIAAIDMAWGTSLTALSAAVGVWFTRLIAS